MKTKHTAGQWELQYYGDNGNRKCRIHSDNVTIATVAPIDEQQANAKLIASAPELIEALQLLLKSHRQLTFEKNHSLNDNWLEEKAHEAILKATK